MRKSLAALRARVERIASEMRLGEGCPTCRNHSDFDLRIEHVLPGHDMKATGGPEACPTCGRKTPVLTIIHELPDDGPMAEARA